MRDNIRRNNYYPFLTWILTILVSPLLWIIYHGVNDGNGLRSLFETLPAFIILGLIFSIPTLGIFLIVYNLLKEKIDSDIDLKSILMVIGVIGVFLTFILIGGSISVELAIFYSITLTIFVWVIKMKRYITSTKIHGQNNNNQDARVS